jgi:AcrR family transcriptional regulator
MSTPELESEAAAASGTRERILVVAAELFARLGFAHVSMREVATAAGVTKPALYYHFRDKEALFEECLTDFNEELASSMRRAVQADGTVRERVLAVVEALLAGPPFHPLRVHEELVADASSPLRQRLRDIFTGAVVSPVTELFAELDAQGRLRRGVDPADAASVLIGACMAFLPRTPRDDEAWTPLPAVSRQVSGPVAAARVTDLVLRGVAES